MIPAFFTALVAVFLAFLSRNEKKHSYLLLLAFVVLTTFLSLGYYWGNDVGRYEERFEYYNNSGIALFDFSQYGLLALKEMGYVFINILCRPLGFWGMRALLFVVENAIIFYFIVKHVDRKWYWLAVFVYVYNPNFWVLSSSMMRQWLAICIIVLSVDFLLRRKYLTFSLLVVLASTIHVSSFVCMVFLPIAMFNKGTSRNSIATFFVVLLSYYILSPFFISYLADFLTEEDFYMGYTSRQGSVGIAAVGHMLIYIYLFYVSVRTKQNDILLNRIVLLYGFVLPLLSFGELSARIGFYFTIFTIAVYPMFMNNKAGNPLLKRTVVFVACAYLLYLYYIFFNGQTYHEAYWNYRMLPSF